MKVKQTLISSVLAASLLVGTGATLAQRNGNGPQTPGMEQGFQGPRGPRGDRQVRPGLRGAIRGEVFDFLSLAEEYTGLSLAELEAARDNGQTLAEMIEANGQSVDDFVDAAVADLSERINTAVENGNMDADRAAAMLENIEERVTARVNGERPIRENVRLQLADLVDLIEEYTGLSAAEMREAQLSGQTLAEMIEANGQSVDAFIAAAVTDINARIDEAVAEGLIDAERGDELKATVEERVTDRVNGEFGGPRFWGPNGTL